MTTHAFLRRTWRIVHSAAPALLLAVVLAGPAVAETVLSPTPHRSLPQARRFLDAADVRVLLPLGYELAPELVGTAEL